MSELPASDPAANPRALANAEAILRLLASMGEHGYIGESISQLEHALQSAHFAAKAGAAEEEILGALLHDIGHCCAPAGAPEMEGLGILSHEQIGANRLRELGFSEKVCELVEGHVQAKRYLVSRNPGYLERLSAASRRTLDFQGGPMSLAERVAFEALSASKAMLRVRAWDEQAKIPELAVLPLEGYQPLLIRHLSRSFSSCPGQRGAGYSNP